MLLSLMSNSKSNACGDLQGDQGLELLRVEASRCLEGCRVCHTQRFFFSAQLRCLGLRGLSGDLRRRDLFLQLGVAILARGQG